MGFTLLYGIFHMLYIGEIFHIIMWILENNVMALNNVMRGHPMNR